MKSVFLLTETNILTSPTGRKMLVKGLFYSAPESSTHCKLRKHKQMGRTQANEENIFINLTTLQHSEQMLQSEKMQPNMCCKNRKQCKSIIRISEQFTNKICAAIVSCIMSSKHKYKINMCITEPSK